ncbi:hypothetical protein [Paludisphaera soli]|uniref:hypothetical protein n=1 Tax=Paludisphaera soli TaxID=2712865 RepID=UPI0013EC81C9|nr:hypothetical protein [Paludisphaera soli]
MTQSRPTPQPPAGSPTTNRPVDRAAAAVVFLAALTVLLLKAPGLDYFLTSRDHGYQLCIGGQVLLGKTPGLDLVTVYGPMAMYTSALGLSLSRSLLGETLLCAGGYSLCFALLYLLVRRDWSRTAGIAAALAGYALMARYYKWYVWLIPLAALWAVQGWLDAPDDRKRRWLIRGGLVVGLSWLYRLDMGTFAGAAFVAMIGVVEARRPDRRLVPSLATFLAAAAVFPLAWMAYLAAVGGPSAPWAFLASSFHGALVVSRGMAAPMPPLPHVVIAFASAAAVLFVATAVGAFRCLRGQGDGHSQFLLASGLIGLAVVHQAMHRRDPAHLLQVVPPIIVAAFATLATIRRAVGSPELPRPARWGLGAFGLLVACGLAYATYGMTPYARWDLVTIGSAPADRLRQLARPLANDHAHPALGVVRFLRENSTPDDPVLVFPLDTQLLPLARRKLSGRLHGYYAGVFDGPEDAEANLDAIRAEPPALVVVPSPAAPRTGSAWPSDNLARRGRAAHAYLDEYVRVNYPRVVYDDGRSAVLSR